jgi:hypothetical protein
MTRKLRFATERLGSTRVAATQRDEYPSNTTFVT